ncbi:hypothetical protein [Undibacterium sp. RuRC25W]|uniref:hypothetical protein n=1 Tax=Undibacterium sp. RuRC25W TaxID=3413047 RepID=UPI003BEFF370
MSKLIALITGTCALLLVQQAVFAADTPSSEAAVPTIELPAHVRHMDAEAASQFVGVYELSNGDALKIVKRGQSLYARLDNEDMMHLVVVAGKNTFVSTDKHLKIHIEHDRDGNVSGEVYIARHGSGLPVMAAIR